MIGIITQEEKVGIVKKRDGQVVPYDHSKVRVAMGKAFEETGNEYTDKVLEDLSLQVLDSLGKKYKELPYHVEDIQDTVEEVLMGSAYKEVAKAYIVYRTERMKFRKAGEKILKEIENITFVDADDDDNQRENANIDGNSPMGSMLQYGTTASSQYNLLNLVDSKASQAHIDGDIHIHDLDFLGLTTTCCQIDLDKLFKNGFNTGHGHLRQPQSIGSYTALAAIAIQSNQNDQHGGQSIPAFDYYMADGVKKSLRKNFIENLYKYITFSSVQIPKDAIKNALKYVEDEVGEYTIDSDDNFFYQLSIELENILSLHEPKLKAIHEQSIKDTERDTYQAMEGFIHNMCTMQSRAGSQTPFSSINYGTDTSPEGRMVMTQLLKATYDGLGNGETPIFPIQIFKVIDGINLNPGDPNYDIFRQAIKTSSKRLFPNFSFPTQGENSLFYDPNDYNSEVAYMGCRTRVMSNVYDNTKQNSVGRGNLSFTTINLPRIAFESNGETNRFYEILDDRIDLITNQLLERFEVQKNKYVYNYPFLMGEGVWEGSENLDWNDKVGEVLKHGSLSVGFIGLAEALKVLTGKHHGESDESQKLGLEIIGYMRDKMDILAEGTELNFSLLATPAESLSGKFVALDKEKYGEVEGVTDKDYYTNSFHVPVYYKTRAIDKIRKEAPYHALTNAGHISYVEVDGDPEQNLEAFESLVRAMHDNEMGYASINHPVDRDPICGHTGVIGDICPHCGRDETGLGEVPFDRIRRITGYLVGGMDRWNNAKSAEEKDRVKHVGGVQRRKD